MNEKATSSRRDFLKLAAVGAPVVAVASVVEGGTAEAAVPGSSSGYHETEHVRKYFDSARF